MSEVINAYCDESCHLEHDHQTVMVLGAVWCNLAVVPEVSERLREIKSKHGLARDFEIKWTKVSPGKTDFYMDVLDYFFDDDHLHARALIVPDKSTLNHVAFGQTHDEWYYKMYFNMLKAVIDPKNRYNIYLDIKDTGASQKVEKLREVLANAKYDFSRRIIERIQLVRSHEVELVQLVDLIIGAIAYANRGLSGNAAKVAIVNRMKKRSGYSLTATTLAREEKLNLLWWQPRENET